VAVVAGFVVTLLGLRLSGDDMFASPFLRAFVGRGVMVAATFGLLFASLYLIFLTARRLRTSTRRPWVEVKRQAGTAVSVLLVGAAVGFGFNVVLTLALARLYDDEIMARADAVDRLERFITLHYEGDSRPLTLSRREDGSYVHRSSSLEHVTDLSKGELLVAEDRRQQYRVDSLDLIGRTRAVFATATGVLLGRPSAQGGSPISEQLAGLLFDIQPYRESTFAARARAKLLKILVGTRVDDLYARDEQTRLYLSRVSFGTFRGHEVEGLREAALAFYGVQPEALKPAQLADLLARVQNPSLYFPYRRPGESEERFAWRYKKHQARAFWILENSRKEGLITEADEQEARRSLFSDLRPHGELLDYLSRPGLLMVFRELSRRAPGDTRHMDVSVGLDSRAQAALDGAIEEARKEVTKVVGEGRNGERVVVDAVVLGETGAIRARAGLYATPGDGASHYKGEIYAAAIARGVISSMSQEVRQGLSGTDALATSDNKAAESLAGRVGLELYQAQLEGQGLRVTGPYPSIALGAGVDGSPLTAAAMFAKFDYAGPGSIFEEPSLLAEVREAGSNRLLFAPGRRRIFSPEVAAEVRKGLEACALKGTAARLAALARAGALNSKTGTAAFMKDGVLVGNGGSWILVNDGPSRSTIAVRMRWSSGRPFAPNGGQSAALVALHLLPRLRAIN
jgi:membrane peptidoglycan carboxypeptidase